MHAFNTYAEHLPSPADMQTTVTESVTVDLDLQLLVREQPAVSDGAGQVQGR